MISKKINLIISVVILTIIISCQTSSLNTIKAGNPNFLYTGRINFTNEETPIFYWPGTYVKANFEGSLLKIVLDDKKGDTYYDVFIDHDYDKPHIINCSKGVNNYLISSTLKDTVHSLLIFRRTEASTGPTKFLGIQLNSGKRLLEPPERPEHKILFYGNSITCGMGNEAPDSSGDDNFAQEDNFKAYGAVAARLLNSDYMCISKSGIGIIISWFDLIMPDYYYRLNPGDSLSQWNFNKYNPDVVVINLFQNDSWLIDRLKPIPDSSQIVKAYFDFVTQVRMHHPNSFIICALGNMDATKKGSPWPGYIEEAVKKMQTEQNDQSITTLFFPFNENWLKHPRVRHHLIMGQNLAKFIKKVMKW